MRKSARQFEPADPPYHAPHHAQAAPRMPLIRLKPHMARVVIEDGAEMILVLKVTLNRGESVELASGGRMETMHGMLRIRERGGLLMRADGKIGGRLTYVPETLSGGNRAPPEFQIDVPLGPREFRVLLDLGRAGRLPHKVFMQAGERTIAGPRGVTYRAKDGRTSKYWDNVAHRRVPVSNLTFVVPVDVANAGASARAARRDYSDDVDPFDDDEARAEGEPKSFASSAQVAELADELIVFQGETRHLLTAILAVVGLTALIVVVVSLLRFLR